MSEKKVIARLDVKLSPLVIVLASIVTIAVLILGILTLHFLFEGIGDGVSVFLPIFGIALVVAVFLWMCTRLGSADIELTDAMIQGKQKLCATSRNIRIPLEQVDNIDVSAGSMDLIRGGKTIAVSTASTTVKFYCVHNADEFAEIALKQIDKYKHTNPALDTKPTPCTNSLSEKLQELQSLKEQGILTDEQFEAKKQELIAKF